MGRRVLDYHVHSEFSVDCRIPMRNSCAAAVAAGVREIAFTDHIDHVPIDLGYGYWNADRYFRSVDECRSEFAGVLTVLAGAEVDFNFTTVGAVERFVAGHSFDFVIGSVHYTPEGELIFPDSFNGKSFDDIFLPYLDQIEAAVETGWFDTIGHLDLPKRYAPATHRDYDPLRYRERFDAIFARMLAGDRTTFEINTSGIRQTPKTSMPGPAIVRWYVEAGGTYVTTGSDSHATQTVGAGIATTIEMLDLCGITHVASYRGRNRTLEPVTAVRSLVSSA
jgi:histidinol-phosphatase (PHP family)